jgi:hypothetical protein
MSNEGKDCMKMKNSSCGPSGAFYGMGVIGAIIYFISTAPTFWTGVLGILKALVWPAIFVYEVFKYLHL